MRITWYGTATLQFSSEEVSVLFDPFFTMNRELPRSEAVELAALGDIFITHGHFDHLIDVPAIAAAGGPKRLIYCSETAAASLQREGVNSEQIRVIQPGEKVEKGLFRIKALKGKHIKFNGKLILKTLFNRRVVKYRDNLRLILKETSNYPQGEVLVYELEYKGKKVLHLGSLNLDETENYPDKVHLLTLPFQGRSDLDSYGMAFVERFQPELLYLHHFDDTFPPVSSSVETLNFVKRVKERFHDMQVIVPRYGETFILE